MSLPRPLKILEVFNRYRFFGGEELAVNRMREWIGARHEVVRCEFSSNEWTRPDAPSTLSQAWRLAYNPDARRRFEAAVEQHQPDVALFHNIYPVGSPALYLAALRRQVPVIQMLHTYRPFAVGGSLYAEGRFLPDSLRGNYWAEVCAGAWMGSRIRSGLMALVLMFLHRSGWLDSVRMWVAISDSMRHRLVEAGAVHPDRIATLRHAWNAIPPTAERHDAGYYLFLGRLVPEKGIEPMLDAWDVLYAQLGRNTPSLHVAGDGPLAQMVAQRARTNPYLCPLQFIAGETKADQLLRCRAVIVPSVWWEPLGLVTYEAYENSKPVLAARSGGLTETVIPGLTGLLHAPGSVEEIVRDVLAVETMSAAERAAMGTAGRNWLLSEASPVKWLREFERIVQRAKAGSQGG